MIISSHSHSIQTSHSLNLVSNEPLDSDRQVKNSVSPDDNAQKSNQQVGQQAGEEKTRFTNSNSKTRAESELQQEEINQLRELSRRDREVRAHEQAHAAVAGSLAKGGPSFSYQRGPDGQLYAVGGEVKIDTSAVAGDPEATAEKARQVRRAALAPAQPSQQDRAVAAAASALEAQARVEIAQQKTENGVEKLNAQFSEGQTDIDNREDGKLDETISSEVHSKCAQCGGQHSAESHTVSVILGDVFNPANSSEEDHEYLLDIAI